MTKKKPLRHIRGMLMRWYRRHFRKEMKMVEDGPWFFQEFADIYGDSINDIDTAESFFADFMKETDGAVIVDFLDTDNWDCIRKIEVDKQNGLVWFYWQIPHEDPVVNVMQKMAFPFDYHGICLKFDNVRFIKGKHGKCFAICVYGYNIREKNIKGFAKAGGWEIKGMDFGSSFFSTSVVRAKDGTSQFLRFMNTPICSFWIIPKTLNVHPQDSEKFLYQIGVEKCESRIKEAFGRIIHIDNKSLEQQKTIIKSAGNEMRNAAENLFKLIMCFYQEKIGFKVENYDDLLLGDLTTPLKKKVYMADQEQEWLGDLARISNDLSHDSGNPVTPKDVGLLYAILLYFIKDFKNRIYHKGNEFDPIETNGKPSPKDYVKEHFHEFCFTEEIGQSLKQTTGKISFTIKAETGTFISIFSEEGDLFLCEDGYFRNNKVDGGKTILKVWNREEVVSLMEKIKEKIEHICDANGFDTEGFSLGVTLDAVLCKEDNPSHLFTEAEIKELMENANDEVNNKLVIDEDGYARIIQNPFQGCLFPVSQETWCAGNWYVGKQSNLTDLHPSYVLCMNLWLRYLETGKRQYDDYYVSDDGIEMIVDKVKKFY